MPQRTPDNYENGVNTKFTDPNDPDFSADPNWRWNAGTGSWEPGNANMDTAQTLTNFVAPGATPNILQASDPGGSLNTGQADDSRSRMAGYLAQLQGQAATGGGAWEQALAQNTTSTQQAASALGQSQPGLDPMSAARGIGNAQAGAAQRAVGQGNLLRAQTQQQAQGQLSDIFAGQGALDSSQASTSAAANQGLRASNENERLRAGKSERDAYSALGQTAISFVGMSEGGEVPGTPKVFGDDHRNDTVPAWLSPDEIVIPISITSRPDAPEAAAAFVRAVQERGAKPGQTHFDSGGMLPPINGPARASTSVTNAPLPGEVGSTVLSTTPDGKQQRPSISNGGLLNTASYDATRTANLGNADSLLAGYAGKGPSVGPQMMQNGTDSTIAEAMRATASGRGPMDVTGAATEQLQGGAGNAAGTVAGESQRAGEAFAAAVQHQRAQDLQMATAQQQAAWRNTMMNAGISLDQQNQLKNLLGSAGQGAVAVSGMFDRARDTGQGYDSGDMSLSGGKIYDEDMGKAFGGEIGYAEGGVVASHLARQGTRSQAKRPNPRKRPTEPSPDLPTMTREEREEESRMRGPVPRDFRDLELNFAQGGSVPEEGALSRFLSYLGSPATPPPLAPMLPEPQGVTPAQLAESLRSPRGPGGEALPPPLPHGQQARERPFIAAPAQKPGPAPVRPAVGGPATVKLAPAPPAGPDADALLRQGAEQKMTAETGLADAQVLALTQGQKARELAAVDMQQRNAQAEADTATALHDLRATSEELRRVDTEVDTGRFFASRSVPGKIFAILGLAMGAVGNDNGNNRAAMLLNQMVDRDIDAQKASHELALRKGRAGVEGAQTYYSLMRQKGLDSVAAGLAAKDLALDKVAADIQMAIAKAGAPLAKSAYSTTLGELGKAKAANEQALSQAIKADRLKWFAAKTDRMQAEAQGVAASAKAQPGFVAPGYALSPGSKPKPEELEKWRTARAAADDIKTKATELRRMIAGDEKTGAKGTLGGMSRFSGDERAKAEALIGSLKVSAKNAYELGAISGSDMDLVMSQIADPVGLSGLFTGDKAMTMKLDQFITNTDQTVTKKGDALGIVKDDQFAEARAWLAANQNHPDAAAVRRKIEAR